MMRVEQSLHMLAYHCRHQIIQQRPLISRIFQIVRKRRNLNISRKDTMRRVVRKLRIARIAWNDEMARMLTRVVGSLESLGWQREFRIARIA